MHIIYIYLIALLGAVVPTGIYFWIAKSFDRFGEKKPSWLLAMTFFWGAIPAMWAATICNRLFNGVMMYDTEVGLTTPEQGSAAMIILGVLTPLAEESLKGLPLLFNFFVFRRYFDGVMDGMLYGAVVGLGFAMVENYLYISRAGSGSGIQVAMAVIVARSIVFGLLHVLWSTLFGIGLGIARHARSNIIAVLAPCCGLVLGMMMHGLHNSSFLWANLQRSYGIPAVVLSLTLYGVGYMVWLILAFKSHQALSNT